MWRSKARVLLIACARQQQSSPAFRNQVPSKTLTLIRPPPHFSSTTHFQNPRFFSNNSSSQDDENGVLDGNPSFISQQSVDPSDGFDENPRFVSVEGIEGGNPSDLSHESYDGDEQMEGVVPEEEEPVVEEILEIDSEQVESVLSILQSSVEGSLESSLNKLDLNVHEEFGIRVIETPLVPGDSLIGFIKWASKKPEFSITTNILDSLVLAISSNLRKKDVYSLWDLIKEIGEKQKDVVNTEILNQLISLFWKLGKGKAALEVFDKFEEFGCDPNADSYYLTIEALCSRSIFEWAWPVCEKMLNAGNLPDSEKIGKIITTFCKGQRAKDAHLVYLMAKEKNMNPPKSCLSYLISSLTSKGATVPLAVELLDDISEDARKYAIKPFSSVVRGLCRLKDIERAKKLLNKMIAAGPPPGNRVFNIVISALSKAGEMEEATGLVKLMESRGLRPDVYTYTLILSGYAKGGQMEDACRILSEAKAKHSKLTHEPYQVLIRAYCELEEFDKALKLLSEMKQSGILPESSEYKTLIQSLCLKAFDWETAEVLLEDMKKDGLYLTGVTRGLIRAVKELKEEEEPLAIEE